MRVGGASTSPTGRTPPLPRWCGRDGGSESHRLRIAALLAVAVSRHVAVNKLLPRRPRARSVRPDHDRHAAGGSRRRLRLRRGADAGDGRARARRRAVRPRLRDRADHADLARQPDDRPLSAGPRRAAQRHAGRLKTCRRSPRPSRSAGFATGAFVGAFPLDRRFGLIKGFQTYGDQMPRDARGRPPNERPGRAVVDEALAWLRGHRAERFFLWVHLFEPHAPYGDPRARGALGARAVRRRDRRSGPAGRTPARRARAMRAATTLIVRHGRSRRGVRRARRDRAQHLRLRHDAARAADPRGAWRSRPAWSYATGVARRRRADDGAAGRTRAVRRRRHRSAARARTAAPPPATGALYAESFAPLLDFGWSPLRSVRAGGWKYIAAPKPELYRPRGRPGRRRATSPRPEPAAPAALREQVDALSPATLAEPRSAADRESARAAAGARLRRRGRADGGDRAPIRRIARELAARSRRSRRASCTAPALEARAARHPRADPGNPQANLRLGYVLSESGAAREAMPHFSAAIAAQVPVGRSRTSGLRRACELAAQESRRRRSDAARRRGVEPDNPVVIANLGLVLSDGGQPAGRSRRSSARCRSIPDLHQAASAWRSRLRGRHAAPRPRARPQELLRRLPADAPQRPEVERLLAAVR